MSAGMDPDQRTAMGQMARAQSEARCFDPRGTDYRTFRITEADAKLLALASEGVGHRAWLFPRKCDVGTAYQTILAAWAVIGERHGFDPETATEHPDGGAQVLARPPAKTGPTMRGGQ